MKTIYSIDPNLDYNTAGRQATIRKPVTVLVQKFDEDGYNKFKNDMDDAHNTGQEVIPIMIDSYGGAVYSLMGMWDIIKSSKLPVATMIQTKAMSCGIALFTAGTEGMRYISPYASLMMHEVSSMALGKVDDVEVGAEEARRLNDFLYKEMSKNCGHDKEFFAEIAHDKKHANWFITPTVAKKYNIANHIGIPDFKVSLKIDYTLEF